MAHPSGINWSKLKNPDQPIADNITVAPPSLLVLSQEGKVARPIKRFLAKQDLQATFVKELRGLSGILSKHSFQMILITTPLLEEMTPKMAKVIKQQQCPLVLLRNAKDKPPTNPIKSEISYNLRLPLHEEELLTFWQQARQGLELKARIHQAEISISRLETLLRNMIDGAFDLVYVLESNGTFLFVNDRLEALLGYRQNTLTGQHYSIMVHQDDLALAQHVFGNRKTGAGLYRNVELRLQPAVSKKGEAPVIVELNSNGLYASDTNEFVGVYGVARQVADRTEAEDASHFQVYHDFLTRLPNRVLFRDRLSVAISHARRDKKTFSVVFLDMDKFKHINDTLGHPAGDQVLKAVTERIKSCLRRGDTLARFGGDEFVLLLPEADSDEKALLIAKKITEQLSQPLDVLGHQVYVGASMGIALYPESGKDVEELITHADQAMYHAKSLDADRYQVFSKILTQKAKRRKRLEQDLQTDLDQGRFSNLYQPRIDLRNNDIVAVAAEACWQHPILGALPQEDFTSAMKKLDLARDINKQVEQNAFQDLLEWQKQSLSPVKLCLNMPVSRLLASDFPETFLDKLTESGIEKSQIEVAIMEDVLTQDLEILAPKLARIGQEGLSIALDRFGAAWFSLFHLQRFPVNTINIDRAFIREISGYEEVPAIKGIVAMASALDIQVVAEGVETKQQIQYLAKLGCNHAQGAYFGPKKPAAGIASLLQVQSSALA